jgi:hypothetical protein
MPVVKGGSGDRLLQPAKPPVDISVDDEAPEFTKQCAGVCWFSTIELTAMLAIEKSLFMLCDPTYSLLSERKRGGIINWLPNFLSVAVKALMQNSKKSNSLNTKSLNSRFPIFVTMVTTTNKLAQCSHCSEFSSQNLSTFRRIYNSGQFNS